MPQGDHGFDARGAARGDVASHGRDQCEQECDARKCQRMGSVNAKEKALQKSRQKKPAGNADQYSDERESQSVADHRSENLCKISAKRDADAEFARALANGVGHDTVNSKTTEQQGPQSEQCQQQGTMGAATETP